MGLLKLQQRYYDPKRVGSYVRSTKEQVGSLVGGRLYTVARQRGTEKLQTDKGTECLNRPFQKLLKEHGVHNFATPNEETKASIVDRFNRTLKTRVWRYFTQKTVGSIC